jgi:hypothetical protein
VAKAVEDGEVLMLVTELAGDATRQCMCILFFISHPVILSFGTPPKWFIRMVLIVIF